MGSGVSGDKASYCVTRTAGQSVSQSWNV